MKNLFLGAVGTIFCLTQISAFANPYDSQSSSLPQSRRVKVKPARVLEPAEESPWSLFIGGDLGESTYTPYNNSLTETSRAGFTGGVRALLAHYWDSWVIDGGLGWQTISNSGTNSDGTKNEDKSQVGYLDVSPRYRFGQLFQVGPEYEYWVSTDQGLNPTLKGTNTISTASNTSGWIGAQALLEWTTDQKFRVGARVLHGVTGFSDRSVNVLQAFVQIGFDVFNSSSDEDRVKPYEQVTERDIQKAEVAAPTTPLPIATPEPSPEELNPDPIVMSTPAAPEPEPEVNSEAAPGTPESQVIQDSTSNAVVSSESGAGPASKKLLFTLDVNDLPFGFNNATLPKSNAARVKNIGEFLQKNNSIWKRLVIKGHTDERGSKAYNERLSLRRAEMVKDLLVEGGANEKKIKAIGLGGSKPKDKHHNERAWTRNRRVELEFQGVSDSATLKKALN